MDVLQKYLSVGNLFLEKEESVVVYFSGNSCYAGFSGEERPRVTLHNVSYSYCVDGVSSQVLHIDTCNDPVAIALAMEPFLRDLFFRRLHASPLERKCVLCTDLHATTDFFLQSVSSVLLEKMRCPAVAFLSSSLAACFSLQQPTVLWIQRTPRETCVIPMVQWGALVGNMAFVVEEEENSADYLAKEIARCLMQCPIDTRSVLASNMVIVNRNAQEEEQVFSALKKNLPQGVGEKVHKLGNPFGKAAPLAWVGASIFGTTLSKKTPATEALLVRKGQQVAQLGQIA